LDENFDEQVTELLKNWTKGNIQSSITKRLELDSFSKSVDDAKDIINNDIKVFLKERHLNKFVDDSTKISIDLSVVKREDIDKNKLRLFLTPTQYNSLVKISTYEKMSLTTPKDRERIKKFVKKGK
jgi:hypothetical protein